MKNIISSTFSIGAQKEVVSVDYIENYYLCEATGTTPSVFDSRWKKVADGGTVPVPTSAAPFLWHKYITVLTDGTKQDPVVEFKGSLGKNGIDYDLVPSHSSIIKSEDGTVSPANVSCSMIMRNADGTAQTLSAVPTGYSIVAYRDGTAQSYSLGSNISTANISVITFVLKYGNVEIERHDIHVIAEGAQGLAGRGIQSQDIRFKAQTNSNVPATPTNDSTWNTWKTLAECGYSSTSPYLYKCVKTVFIDGNNSSTTEYYVEGPTVWGQDGKTAFVVDIDNEMTAVPVTSEGKVAAATTLSFNVKAFYGTENVTSNCEVKVQSSLPTGFTVDVVTSKSTPTVTIAKDTTPAELTEITLRVTHATHGWRDVVFSVAAIKAGGVGQDAVIYQLLPSQSEISVARTDAGGYNPATVALTCGYTKRKGNAAATSVADATSSFDGYYIFFRRYNRTSGWESTWYRYFSYKDRLASLNVATYSKVEFAISNNKLPTIGSLGGIIDREVVPIIADGLNGTSPYTVDLSKEMTSVALTSAGVTAEAFEETFSLKAFYGSTDVTAGLYNVSAHASPNNNNVKIDASDLANIKVSIPVGVALDSTTSVIFGCPHKTYGSTSITHTLVGVRAGAEGKKTVIYEILPDLTQVSFARTSSGSLTPVSRTINFSIKKVEGDTVSVLSISASGLSVRYSISSMPATVSDGNKLTSFLTIPSTTAATNIYVAVFNSADTLVDRETIPVIKDGEKGGTGDPGTGISSISYYRMFTQSFEAPSVSDSWKGRDDCTESMLSATNRYLWEKKVTRYTRTSVSDTNEIYLVAQFASSPCANLLADTAFLSDAQMNAWEQAKGSVLVQAHTGLPQNGWQLTPDLKAGYTEMLAQIVFDGSVKKIKPNTWYTLSFYAAQAGYISLFSGSTYNGEDGSGYYQLAKAHKSFRIEAGQTVKVRFTGRVNNLSYAYMRCWVWVNSLDDTTTWLQATVKDIKSTANTTVEVEFTNNQSSACMCHVAPYMIDLNDKAVETSDTNYRGYCTQITVDRGQKMFTYLYRSGSSNNAISNSEPWYIDGQKVTAAKRLDDGTYISLAKDGSIQWKLSPTSQRHSITFKTTNFSSSITDIFRVLFRMTAESNYGWVSMPKLEENTIATEWSENSADRYADEIQHVFVGLWRASTQGDASTNYLYALGVRHVVKARQSATGDYTFFRMKKRTTNTGYCSLTEPYADTANWERADYMKFVAADLLLTEEVVTDKLTVSKIRTKNDKFYVDENGAVVADGGVFDNISASKANIQQSEVMCSYSPWQGRTALTPIVNKEGDNLFYDGTFSSIGGFLLPNDVSNAGRVIRLTPNDLSYSETDRRAAVGIYPKSGSKFYFFEDGLKKSRLVICNELVELLGVGTKTTFQGYVVLKRINLTTVNRYGRPLQVLAYGTVKFVPNSGASISYVCFDKSTDVTSPSTMSVTRFGVGKYRVFFPRIWGSDDDTRFVMLTAVGGVYGSNNRRNDSSFGKATLLALNYASFDVGISDDESANDGDFNFVIYDTGAWNTIDGTINPTVKYNGITI